MLVRTISFVIHHSLSTSLFPYLREFAPRMELVSSTSKTSLHRPRLVKCSSRQMFLLLATTTTIHGHSIVQIWNLIKFLCHVSDENELHHYLHILARLYMIMFASIGFSNMSCTTIYIGTNKTIRFKVEK